MDQVVECLSTKHETLSSNQVLMKKKKKRKETGVVEKLLKVTTLRVELQ
jgi:hypothetical protein